MTAIAGLAGAGDTAVIGMPARLPLRDAALINGILVHGLDFDDTHSGGVIHATASVLPTVLAVGAQQRASGRDMLAAYMLGVEVAARLGAVAKGAFHQVGFHPTGLIGAFACALAAGRLMGLDEKQLVMAQGIDACRRLRAASNFSRTAPGTSVSIRAGRRLPESLPRRWRGRASSAPSAPMRAASASMPAICRAISIRPISALATAGLGETWELHSGRGEAVPRLPLRSCLRRCRGRRLTREHKLDAGEIEQVRALVPAEVVKTVCEPAANKRRPANSYDAQFSIPYTVAAALRRGRFTLDELEDDALGDADILALADRVNYEIDPATTFPRHYTGEVVVTLRGGRTLRHREAVNRGNGERPLSEAEIIEKFQLQCGARGLGATGRGDRDAAALARRAADVGAVADRLAERLRTWPIERRDTRSVAAGRRSRKRHPRQHRPLSRTRRQALRASARARRHLSRRRSSSG